MTMLLTVLFLFLAAASCGPGTSTGNPVSPITVRMEDKQPLAWLKRTLDILIPPAHAGLSNVKFCFKRLRFKPDSSTTGSNFDLALGEVEIVPGGTNLLTVSVPRGIYTRIEFDLDKECQGTSGLPSVSYTNANTSLSYASLEHITIKFDGVYEVTSAETLTLDIDILLDALEPVNNNANIKTALESVSGTY
ncbi:MAG TPA: hypothetical protein VNJ01_08265 [Bacteriovoracaceae bacterium]|nr:hypothetical protein [Bacteriovoracaceae bacterium]